MLRKFLNTITNENNLVKLDFIKSIINEKENEVKFNLIDTIYHMDLLDIRQVFRVKGVNYEQDLFDFIEKYSYISKDEWLKPITKARKFYVARKNNLEPKTLIKVMEILDKCQRNYAIELLGEWYHISLTNDNGIYTMC